MADQHGGGRAGGGTCGLRLHGVAPHASAAAIKPAAVVAEDASMTIAEMSDKNLISSTSLAFFVPMPLEGGKC